MLPAITIYTDALPDGVGGCANGPVIRIRPKYRDDAGIHAHEHVHVRQWYVGVLAISVIALAMLLADTGLGAWWPVAVSAGASLHPLAYLAILRYRLWAEARAYLEQLRHYPDDRTQLFATFMATRYGLSISVAEAMDALRQ